MMLDTFGLALFVMIAQMVSLHFQAQVTPASAPTSDPTMSSIIKDHNAAFTSVGLVMLSVTYVSLVYLLLRKRDCFFFNVMYLLANGVVISVLSSIFSPFLCGFIVLLSLFSTIFVILSQSKRF
jgi:hypothetical protein